MTANVQDPHPGVFIHESSYVDAPCRIGAGTSIWHFCHVMKDCEIGERCKIGQNVVISPGVRIGNNVKIQNNVSVYTGVVLGDDAVANLYGGIDSLPTTFVINREGKVVDTHVGLIGKDDYISEIKSLLNGANKNAVLSNSGSPTAALLSLGAIR